MKDRKYLKTKNKEKYHLPKLKMLFSTAAFILMAGLPGPQVKNIVFKMTVHPWQLLKGMQVFSEGEFSQKSSRNMISQSKI